MIPKIIHYCWFGRKKMPILAYKCINSWKKFLPDYDLKLWNEENFDIKINHFVEEAYYAKKYAFVADYVRMFALYYEGGIYLDADVEVLKNLDRFLVHSAFSGFENNNRIPTGIMGSIPNHSWIKALLDYYNDKHFIINDGKMDLISNVHHITKISEQFGLKKNNRYQILKGDVHIYPSDYFNPLFEINGKAQFTENTYTIHHFCGSWLSPSKKFKQIAIKILLQRILKIPYLIWRRHMKLIFKREK